MSTCQMSFSAPAGCVSHTRLYSVL